MHIKKLLTLFFFSAIIISGQNSDSTETDISSFFINFDQLNQLPIRGMKNILSLSPGIVLHNDKLYSRGSRDDEIQYYIEGAPITDAMNGGYLIEIPQEAFERIDIQTGGVSVQYGNANSGYVFHKLKRGTNEYKANVKYFSDNISLKSSDNAYDGNKRLGAYWYGHNEILGEVSGPIIKNKLTFCTLAHYKYERDQNPQAFPGAETDWIYDYWYEDSVKISLPAGAQPANSQEQYGFVGNLRLQMDYFSIQINGIVNFKERFIPNGNNVLNFMNYGRTQQASSDYYSLHAVIQHRISETIEYKLNLGYSNHFEKRYDPLLRDDYLNYFNSNTDPGRINILNMVFNNPGYITSGYYMLDQSLLFSELDFSFRYFTNNVTSVGLSFQQHIIKKYDASRMILSGYYRSKILYHEYDPKRTMQMYGIDNYGYDEFGEENDSDDIFGARKPVNASISLENIYKKDDFLIQAGLRIDYFNSDNYKFTYTDNFWYDYIRGNDILPYFSKVEDYFYLSPRITMNYRTDNNFSFYSHFGKYIQQTKYSDIYKGLYDLLYCMTVDGYSVTGIGLDLKPTSTYLSEIGIKWHSLNWIITAKGYYKKSMNLPINNHVNYPFNVLGKLENRGEAIVKGIETSTGYIGLDGLSLIINMSYTNGYGPSIYNNSWMGQQYNEIIGIAEPTMYAPLENSYSFYGDVIASYEFPDLKANNLFRDMSISARIHVNSGHPYNRWNQFIAPTRYYQLFSHVQLGDFNSFTTPWILQMDFRINKTVNLSEKLKLSFDLMIVNLFDIMNEMNLFPRTGTTQNDGYTSSETIADFVEIYGEGFIDLYRIVEIDYYNSFKSYTGFNLFGPPRQIFFGIALEY